MPTSTVQIVDSSKACTANLLAVQKMCVVCGESILHDRVVYETIGGELRYALVGRAHGDCMSGPRREHDVVARRMPTTRHRHRGRQQG